jgi:hypothetical protein
MYCVGVSEPPLHQHHGQTCERFGVNSSHSDWLLAQLHDDVIGRHAAGLPQTTSLLQVMRLSHPVDGAQD